MKDTTENGEYLPTSISIGLSSNRELFNSWVFFQSTVFLFIFEVVSCMQLVSIFLGNQHENCFLWNYLLFYFIFDNLGAVGSPYSPVEARSPAQEMPVNCLCPLCQLVG